MLEKGGLDMRCLGRVDPFSGDLVACGNACKHYIGSDVFPFVDATALQRCQDQGAPTLGSW